MEIPTPIEIPVEDEAKQQVKKEKDTFNKVKWTLFISCAVIFILFLINRPFGYWSSPFDEGLLGTYGDFIGGFIGTLVTLYSVYLLVKTLGNQIEVNSNIVRTNNNIVTTNKATLKTAQYQAHQTDLTLFDSKSNAYLKAYQDAVNGYVGDNCFGKECLEELVHSFRNSGFNNEVTYIHRTEAAVKAFESFYAENRTLLSTHMRTLYLLMQLIADKGNIDEEDRVAYAKCIRGQLSEAEMFVLRYNCYTEYGKNMQKYVNRYNLLKHLPTMNLLEFNQWRKKIDATPSYINAIDALFLKLRKETGDLLVSVANDDEEVKKKEIPITKNYQINISFSKDNKRYEFTLMRILQVSRYGYKGKPDIEKALDSYKIGELRQMMLSYHQEFFFCNNFSIYNGDNGNQRTKARVSSSKDDTSTDIHFVHCKIVSDYPIVLKNMQLENPS